ncbi:MAG: PKD domain-containing protein [Candidatus Altiarchaeales archaeon]|nr:PKD domain-containing protein [Candidatus Altiarchaeales archaeon]
MPLNNIATRKEVASPNPQEVWSDGTYVYVADGTDGLRAYSFNGVSFSLLDTILPDGLPFSCQGVWGDGTYIYVSAKTGGLFAFTFDGAVFSQIAKETTYTVTSVYGDGTYVYAAGWNDLVAYTFDGAAFTVKDNTTPLGGGPYKKVFSDGTYVYVGSDNDGLVSYSFDGTFFSRIDSDTTHGSCAGVWYDGTYIYAGNSGLEAFTFDGSSLTSVTYDATISSAEQIFGHNGYLYLAAGGDGLIRVFYDGSSFSVIDTYYDTGPTVTGVHAVGSYVYTTDDTNGLTAWYDATAPSANFSGTPTSGNQILSVTFTDSSAGSPTSWSWDFGDSSSSADQNPTHQYSSPGTYTVSLTSTNATGSDSKTRTDYITVSAVAPVVDFSALPTSGDAPLSVDFTDQSTTLNTSTYLWKFGDGYTSTAQDPTHVYQHTGTYTVSLTVTDSWNSVTTTKNLYINVGAANTLIKTNDEAVDSSIVIASRMFISGDADYNNILKGLRVYLPASTQNPNESGFRRPYGPGLIAD